MKKDKKLNSLLITQKNKYKQLQRKRSSKQCVSKTFLLSQSITNVPLSLSKMTVLSDDFFTIFDDHIHIIYFDIVDAAQWISIDDEHISTLAFDYASCLVIAAQCFGPGFTDGVGSVR